ncbi:MAG: putative dehydrogenase [Candidatus Latescibacterota bacterium]|jgi:predicted dehydrogenase
MKIAILGTGQVARASYLPFLSRQDDVELIYFSRTREKAASCAADFGGIVADSLEQLLADDPDAVLVLTHETQRYEATQALLAGKPRRLFFEKPLVAAAGQANVSEDDFLQARNLLQQAKDAGAESAMVFNYRFFEQTIRAQELIAERDFGKLIQASLFVNYACWSHCIDLLHLFGGRAARITALAGDIPYKDAVDVAAAFQLENGATGTITGTSGSDFSTPLYDVLLNFERGSVRFRDLDGPLEVHGPGQRYAETHALIGNHSRWDQYQASFEKSLAAYLDSIRSNEPPPVPGMAGLEELQFEAALRRSIREQRPVDLAREFSLDP